jgi:hypothetical protein
VLLASLAAPAVAQTAWDMSVVWPPGNFHTKNAMKFAERSRTSPRARWSSPCIPVALSA